MERKKDFAERFRKSFLILFDVGFDGLIL